MNLEAMAVPFVSLLAFVFTAILQRRLGSNAATQLASSWYGTSKAQQKTAGHAASQMVREFEAVADRIQIVVVVATLVPGTVSLFGIPGFIVGVIIAVIAIVTALLTNTPKTAATRSFFKPFPFISKVGLVTFFVLIALIIVATFVPLPTK